MPNIKINDKVLDEELSDTQLKHVASGRRLAAYQGCDIDALKKAAETGKLKLIRTDIFEDGIDEQKLKEVASGRRLAAYQGCDIDDIEVAAKTGRLKTLRPGTLAAYQGCDIDGDQ